MNHIISIDLWSIVHFISGVLLLSLLIYYFNYSTKKNFLLTFGALVIWEIFEFILYGVIKTPYFLGETVVNVGWDLFVGMAGATLAFIIARAK